jgi:beta-glucanase (GH16 family)
VTTTTQMWLRICPFVVFVVVMCAKGQTAWKMVWSDEFSGPANSQPDSTKWGYDLGAGGWGNAELETYTNAAENAHLDGNGNLIIRALSTASGVYTSGRLKTQGKFDVTYGKIEARIKLPFGQGIWPAFWMIGSNIGAVGWPACGEIDIMENIGREPSINHGSMHGPGYGENSITATYTLSGGKRFSDDFHLFTIVWSPESVEFFVDSISYQKVTFRSLPPGKKWVFNKPFFLLLNLAVGGTFSGYPDATTQFPQEMTVDYVRVYRAVPAPGN